MRTRHPNLITTQQDVSTGHRCAHVTPHILPQRKGRKRRGRRAHVLLRSLRETGFYAPSVAHNALPRRPWRCISVVLSIILQTLGSFAMRSRKSTCARRPLRLRPLRCGKMCVVTCAHRWPVLTSCCVVVKCEIMRCATDRYLYFSWESEVCGRGVGIYCLGRANSEAV